MKERLKRIYQSCFGSELELRVRIFNVLAVAGAVGSFVTGTISLLTGAALSVVLAVYAASLLSVLLIIFALRTGKYRLCYIITIAVVFMGFFSYLFFRSGGYHGGNPLYFVFAAALTVFMLEGKAALIATVAEFLLYAGMYAYAYLKPESVVAYSDEWGYFINNLGDLIIVGVALSLTMYAQVKLYRAQQKKLDEQNAVLLEVNRSKTQFLANTSHEMRTPLTVVSVNIQTVMGILKRMEDFRGSAESKELLEDAQGEIMRLSRMVAGMLSLNTIAESAEKGRLDITALLMNTAEMLRLIIVKKGNSLELSIADSLTVYGSADLLSQVVINLIQNANTHTDEGVIRLPHPRRAL